MRQLMSTDNKKATVTPGHRGWACGAVRARSRGNRIAAAEYYTPSRGLLQQPGHPAVGQRLVPGLAGRAVLERGVGEGDLAHGVAADGAGPARPAVHLKARLLLRLEL